MAAYEKSFHPKILLIRILGAGGDESLKIYLVLPYLNTSTSWQLHKVINFLDHLWQFLFMAQIYHVDNSIDLY